MKRTLICIDRDGTLIYDTREHLFLGRDDDWPKKVRILPGVVDGLVLLNSLPEASIFMITNQAGVAISDFPLLTVERAHEVCRYVLELLRGKGALMDGYFLCPHVPPEYAASKPETNFYPHLVKDCHCFKPELGMVFDALKNKGVTPQSADVYVIGDRATDVQTGLNVGGTGILVPFANEPGEKEKVENLPDQRRILIAPDLLAAAEYVVGETKRLNPA